jgi:hypothetical protein
MGRSQGEGGVRRAGFYLLALEEIRERQVLSIDGLEVGLTLEQVLAHGVRASKESLAAANCVAQRTPTNARLM